MGKLALIILLGLFFIGCSDENSSEYDVTSDNSTSPFVGIWQKENDNEFMIFNRNGTGEEREYYNGRLTMRAPFRWSTDNGVVTIIYSGFREYSEYEYNNGKMHIFGGIWVRTALP